MLKAGGRWPEAGSLRGEAEEECPSRRGAEDAEGEGAGAGAGAMQLVTGGWRPAAGGGRGMPSTQRRRGR